MFAVGAEHTTAARDQSLAADVSNSNNGCFAAAASVKLPGVSVNQQYAVCDTSVHNDNVREIAAAAALLAHLKITHNLKIPQHH